MKVECCFEEIPYGYFLQIGLDLNEILLSLLSLSKSCFLVCKIGIVISIK